MTVPNKPLVLDLLESLAEALRPYADVMAAWRTSCPRLPIWEDACDHGFVARRPAPPHGLAVELTPAGAAFLHVERPVAVGATHPAR